MQVFYVEKGTVGVKDVEPPFEVRADKTVIVDEAKCFLDFEDAKEVLIGELLNERMEVQTRIEKARKFTKGAAIKAAGELA